MLNSATGVTLPGGRAAPPMSTTRFTAAAVAGHAEYGLERDVWMPHGQRQRHGVVDARVDIQDGSNGPGRSHRASIREAQLRRRDCDELADLRPTHLGWSDQYDRTGAPAQH